MTQRLFTYDPKTRGDLGSEQSVREVVGRLTALAGPALQQARAARRPALVSTTVPLRPIDPIEIVGQAAAHSIEPMLWTRPQDGFSIVGIGRAWEHAAAGRGRFERARDAWDQLKATAPGGPDLVPSAQAAAAASGVGPVLVGGFSFSPAGPVGPEWGGFDASSLVLPSLVFATSDDIGWLTACLVVRPEMTGDEIGASIHRTGVYLATLDRPGVADGSSGAGEVEARIAAAQPARGLSKTELTTAQDWKALVGLAARAVRAGDLKKVVLARALRVGGAAFHPVEALRRLRAGYPTCAVFAVVRQGRWFVGATPERLVRVRRGEVSAMALAGSAPRGTTPAADRGFGEALLASAKDRLEHAIVADMVRQSLSGVCEAISVAGSPTLLKVSNVQHLHTPIAARLCEGRTILDLADRLHPTPAVGGVPREAALEWLHRHEGLDRGWYAGPVGWIDAHGDGEFAVAIRSALLAPGEALLYAGCGIVADSDPDAEYAESQLKLRAMLAALAANGDTPGAGSGHAT
jgi:isochorismate synthase